MNENITSAENGNTGAEWFKHIINPNECQTKCQDNTECEFFLVLLTGEWSGCWLKTAPDNDNKRPREDAILGPKFCEGMTVYQNWV